MPINVKSLCITIVFFFAGASAASGQTQPPQAADLAAAKAPTAADVMRDRISKAKANIAVRNYPAALYELENIRRETTDPSVNAVVNVLMMNSYIEQGDYKRAEGLLQNHFESYKRNNAHADVFYQAVAGQVIKSARNQADRYRSLGLTVSDRNLPLEAVNDIERMRELVEAVVTQAKESAADPAKTSASAVLLEEAVATRSAIARDDYDARRWRDAAADAREDIARSQSVVINAVDGKPLGQPAAAATPQKQPAETQTAAVKTADISQPATPQAASSPAATKPTIPDATPAPAQQTPALTNPAAAVQQRSQAERPVRIVGGGAEKPSETEPSPDANANAPETTAPSVITGPLEVGSLIAYATSQSQPRYPSTARQMRANGIVRVEIIVDESGEVAEVTSMSGHALLQPAARDAIQRWKFRPFKRDGEPVKAAGYVNFNFSL